MINTQQQGYYAIITADVRYDKRLTPNAKLLYAEITALTSSNGTCWASNKYFSDLYEVDKRTIQRWLNTLAKCGYISIKQHEEKRVITLQNTPRQNCHPPMTKMSHPRDKNVTHNNTSNNTKNINLSKESSPKAHEREKSKQDFKAKQEHASLLADKLATNNKRGYVTACLNDWKQQGLSIEQIRELAPIPKNTQHTSPSKAKDMPRWEYSDEFLNSLYTKLRI